jgi:hypothetical protein
MERAAEATNGEEMAFGAFEVIGHEYVRRAARAWWPKE